MLQCGSLSFDAVDAFVRHVARSQALTAILAGRVMRECLCMKRGDTSTASALGIVLRYTLLVVPSMKPSPITKKLDSLQIRAAAFIEPMECLAVPRLPDGSQWLFEILCGPPHKTSYVVLNVMWR
jgi:hypothetical protein